MFVPGSFDDDDAFDTLAETLDELCESHGIKGNAAFYLSIPPAMFPIVLQQMQRTGMADNDAAGGWRRVVVEKPFGHDLRERARAQRAGRRRVHRAGRVPHRPLPGQGDRPEPDGAAVRQPAVRAGLERQLRRLGADHDGRGRRHRRPGRVLRRDRRRPRRAAEPPAAAAGADRDGGAGRVHRRGDPDREAQGAAGDHAARTTSSATPSAASTTRAGRPASGPRPTAPRRTSRADSNTETYAAVRLGIETRRWAGVPFYLRTGKRLPRRVTEIARAVQEGAAPAVQPDRHRGTRPQPARHPGPARRGRHAEVRFEGAGLGDGGPRRLDGLPLRRGVHRVLPRGLRAADPRRPARRRDAVPAQRRGRGVLAGHRPARGVLGRPPAGTSTGPASGARRRPTRCSRATAAPGGGHDARGGGADDDPVGHHRHGRRQGAGRGAAHRRRR